MTSATAAAQTEAPRIGPFVVDFRGALTNLPNDAALAASRGLNPSELPGTGLGFDAGVHFYLVRWKAMTVGVGGQLTWVRGSYRPPEGAEASFRPVTERFTTLAPHLSLNFGTGNGWSYVSGGVGGGGWSAVPDGVEHGPADEERLRVWDYGGGARWFASPHLAFTFDVRVHVVDPGSPFQGRPGSPQTLLLILGAGLSIK